MELIFEEKKKEYSAKLRQTNRAIWLTLAIWLVGVCLFLLLSVRQNGFGRWGCTVLTFLAFAVIIYFAGLRRKDAKALAALYEKLDEGSVYREYLVFDEELKPERTAGNLLVPCRFFETSGGDRKIYLPPQGELKAEKGQKVTVENTSGVIVSCRDRETDAELLSVSAEPEKPVSVKAFLSRFALVLSGGAVVSVMLIGLLFTIFHSPKANESVYIFYGGKVQSYSIERRSVKEIDDAGILLVEISSSLPGDAAFMEKYSVVGLSGCNIIIVPEDIAEQTSLQYTAFEQFCDGAELPLEIASRITYYVRDGKNAGIYVEGRLKEKLAEYFEFDELKRYVMFSDFADFNASQNHEGYSVARLIRWLFEE